MRVLFDGDILVYRGAWRAEKDMETDPSIDPGVYMQGYFFNLIDLVLFLCKAQTHIVYLSEKGGASHRMDALDTIKYKANRKNNKKPTYYNLAREVLINTCNTEIADNLEADDLLGINQRDDTVIASVDKDLKMVPGVHFNLNTRVISTVPKGLGTLSYVNKKLTGGGFVWFCAQMLMGDTVDNIPGVRGIGPVRAYDILKDTKSMKESWEAVAQTYKDHENDSIREHAVLLWILQNEEESVFDWLEIHLEE